MDIGLLPGRCSPHIRSAVSLCPAGVAKQRWRSGWVVGWYIKIRRSVSGPKWGQQVDRSMDYRCIDHDDQEEDHITPRPRPRALARSREVLVFTACAAGEGKRGGCRLPPETCVYYITTCPRDHVACGHARGAHGGRPRHPRSTAGRPADGITRTYVRRTRARGRPAGCGRWDRARARRPGLVASVIAPAAPCPWYGCRAAASKCARGHVAGSAARASHACTLAFLALRASFTIRATGVRA